MIFHGGSELLGPYSPVPWPDGYLRLPNNQWWVRPLNLTVIVVVLMLQEREESNGGPLPLTTACWVRLFTRHALSPLDTAAGGW
jgi:hypothetical protein